MSTDSRQPGVFTISLDFELYWGVHDKIALESCRSRLLGARGVVPRLLELFGRYGVHATWATVGFLFFDEKDELLASLPDRKPRYADPAFSPYDHLRSIGPDERRDPYHYARSLIRRIQQYPGQEIGTHTFSHYYCLEEGQTRDDFRADLQAARAAAEPLGITLRSIVFPRNQWREDYLEVCAEAGISALRGCERAWMYRPRGGRRDGYVQRAGRLADSYVNLAGRQRQRPVRCGCGVTDIPSSRFLRPFSPRLAPLDPLRLSRIRNGMTDAAQHGATYHLWWHPHNFGSHQKENLAILTVILAHFARLTDQFGMISRAMGESILDGPEGRAEFTAPGRAGRGVGGAGGRAAPGA